MLKLNKRQKTILQFIRQNGQASNKDIVNFFIGEKEEISRFTVLRDLDELVEKKYVNKIGKGRSVSYELKDLNLLFQFVDVEKYFSQAADERQIKEKFNFEIFNDLENLFSAEDLLYLDKLNLVYRKRIKTLSPAIMKKEFERLTIELSWKSSRIEGNTYSLLETEVLLKEKKEAKGKKHEEAVMILNHKKALDFARDKKSDFKKISLRKIENIHSLIVDDLGVGKGVRKRMVGITGTKYKPLDNEFQIKEALEKLAAIINKFNDPFAKALAAVAMISYIQPFEDGNKRTGRILGNAILLAHDVCPLSYRSVDELEYKKAILLFYEQNNLSYFKKLFMEQYEFAVNTYFLA